MAFKLQSSSLPTEKLTQGNWGMMSKHLERPCQSLQVVAGAVVGLKEHVTILTQGSSDINRHREIWELFAV